MAKTKAPQFDKTAFFKAAIPSYFFPFASSFLPGYLLNKPDLMKASYSSIALPSLIATIITFFLLSQFQKRQILRYNRFVMTLIIGVFMMLLALLIIKLIPIQTGIGNILSSAFIGTAIIAMTKPLKKI